MKVRVPFALVDDKFPSGPVALRVLFTYQACDEAGSCFPPQWAESVVRFTADTPNPPLAAGDVRGSLTPRVRVGDVAPEERPDGAAGGPAGVTSGAAAFALPQLTAEDWAEAIPWQTWQPGLAEELSRRGHLVYVDYTADW